MKIFLATDHAGFELKERVRELYTARGFDVIDIGAHIYDAADDYTVYMHGCAERYSGAGMDDARMIVFGGSGTGEAIVMNRYSGVRAVVYNGQSFDVVRFARLHNDANCLSIGARFVSYEDALEAIELFLVTEFEGGRHSERVQNIEKSIEYENWHKKKAVINKSSHKVHFNEGQIWMCSLGKNIGFEQDGKGDDFLRPILVIKKFSSDGLFCFPLTHTIKQNRFYCDVLVKKETSSVILSQGRFIDVRRLRYRIANLSERDMLVVKEKASKLLGILLG